MTKATISRREFLGRAAAVGLLSAVSGPLAANEKESDWLPTTGEGIPLVDYHVHVDKPATLEQVLAISRQRGVKFGIVEHAGTKANKYPRILSSDEELKGYLAELEGKPVFKGVQAEWIDWMTCFSKEMIAKLDYVLTDAMTLRGKDGKPVRMWDAGFKVGDVQDFMDRYVDFHVELMSLEPIDILANPTYLPGSIAKDYDALWTPSRMQKIIDAAVKYGIAIEINAGYRIPRLPFLKQAKAAGAKFSFGTNIRGPNVGKLDYALEMVKALGLTRADIFTPAPPGKKAVQRR
jgi:histidinol phosphatase-like PHP family hydrolase